MAVILMDRVFTSSRATLSARLVLLVIAAQIPDGGESTRLSLAEMSDRARLSRRQVITAVQQLEQLGEIVIIPGRGPGPSGYNQQVFTLAAGLLPPPPVPAPDAAVQARRRSLRYRGVQRTVWDRDKWTCQERRDDGCTPHAYLTIGHRISVEDGGTDDLDNLQTECEHCNKAKGAR